MSSILGMAGFAIDLGTTYVQLARLQKVADSAAMAGAVSWMKTGSTAAVTATIQDVVVANGWPATIIQAGTPPYLAQSPKNSTKAAIQVTLTAATTYSFMRAITTASPTPTTAYAAVELGGSRAIPTVFDTGVNASGAVLPSGTVNDPHYVLISVPQGASSTVQVGPTGAASYWTGTNTTSAWIGPVGGAGNVPSGWYVFRTTFDLTGYDPTTITLAGQVDADDSLYLQLNSAAVVSTSASYYNSATFSMTTGFVAGVNTMYFYVYNNSGATGLRVDMAAASGGGTIALVK